MALGNASCWRQPMPTARFGYSGPNPTAQVIIAAVIILTITEVAGAASHLYRTNFHPALAAALALAVAMLTVEEEMRCFRTLCRLQLECGNRLEAAQGGASLVRACVQPHFE